METKPNKVIALSRRAEATSRAELYVRKLGATGLKHIIAQEWRAPPVNLRLTKAEFREAESASRGLRRNEAAAENGKATETVKNLRARVIAKTASVNMAEASFKLIVNGHIDFEPDTVPPRWLNARYQQVADLICQGCSDREIAEHLEIGFQQAKDYVSDLRDELGAANRSHVPRRMFETGRYGLARARLSASSHSAI